MHLPRRAHNPILLDAGLIGTPTAIPWWGGRPLRLKIEQYAERVNTTKKKKQKKKKKKSYVLLYSYSSSFTP